MASRTNRERLDSDSLEELRREFDRRVEEIRSKMGEQGHSKADEPLDYLKNDLGRVLSDLRLLLDESVEPGREAIRERPYLAVGVALGIGVLLGVVLGRKKSEE